MTARGSLRQRLLAAAALWIAFALGVVGVLLVGLFRHHVEQELAQRAQGQLDALIAGLVVTAPPPGATSPPRLVVETEPPDPAFQQPFGGLYWLVGVDGAVRLRSRSWWDHPLDATASTAWQAVAPGRVERFSAAGPDGQALLLWARRVELAGMSAPVVVAVGADGTRVAGLTQSFARTVALALALLALALWAAAWLQVRLGLAPLGGLQDALRGVRQGDSTVVGGRHPAEVQPLVDELNAVLADNEALLEHARQQAGNLAHALKTPLAVVGNAAARWPGDDGALVRQQLERMRRQVDWHLVRARAAARAGGLQRGGVATPVAPALDDLRRVLMRLHAERGVTIDLQVPAPSPSVAAEPDPLKEMLGNLLDNACKWAAKQVRVTVALEAGDPVAGVRIAIDDDGPGIPADRRAEALQRGQRLDERRPGSGLGLAIVDELARLHGGSLELADADRGGLRAVLCLPSAALQSRAAASPATADTTTNSAGSA